MPERLDDKLLNPRRHFPVILGCMLFGLEPALSFVGPVAGVAIFGGWNPQAMYLTAVIVNALAVICLCGVFLKKLDAPAVFQVNPTDLFAGVMCTVCVYPAALAVSELIGRVFPDNGVVANAVMDSTVFGPALAWILMAALPATSEELLFRGVLFGSFRKYGLLAALGVSSVCFALIHGSIRQMSYTLLMGVIWALLREFSGSVLPGMLGHMAFNSVALLAAFQPSGSSGSTGAALPLMPLAVMSVVFAACGVMILRFMKRRMPAVLDREPFWVPAAIFLILALAANFGVSYLIASM